jgi:hypothetical protein
MTSDPLADLAESMVPVACDLACRVRDGDTEGIGRLAEANGWDTRTAALLVVLAAMVPVEDASLNDLLAWTGGLEKSAAWRQEPLPLREKADRVIAAAQERMALMLPRVLEPCPSLAAYRRHVKAGEPCEDCGCMAAARAAWRAKKRLRAGDDRRAAA